MRTPCSFLRRLSSSRLPNASSSIQLFKQARCASFNLLGAPLLLSSCKLNIPFLYHLRRLSRIVSGMTPCLCATSSTDKPFDNNNIVSARSLSLQSFPFFIRCSSLPLSSSVKSTRLIIILLFAVCHHFHLF